MRCVTLDLGHEREGAGEVGQRQQMGGYNTKRCGSLRMQQLPVSCDSVSPHHLSSILRFIYRNCTVHLTTTSCPVMQALARLHGASSLTNTGPVELKRPFPPDIPDSFHLSPLCLTERNENEIVNENESENENQSENQNQNQNRNQNKVRANTKTKTKAII